MFGRSRTWAVLETAKPYADRLVADAKLRDRLASALAHATVAGRRTNAQRGVGGFARRIATDRALQEHVRLMARELGKARGRMERKKKQKYPSRRVLLLLLAGGGVAAVAVPQSRAWLKSRLGGGWGLPEWQSSPAPATIASQIEVDVPLTTAYNQWTQFEEFPLFMEGVDVVEQLDDTTLHWVATVAGKRGEWDAKILEQEPDRRIVWQSIDGTETRGAVTFTKLDPSRTRVSLSMSYRPQDTLEQAGSALGLDQRRVRGDLERFKQHVESQGAESDGWRGEVKGGQEL